MKLNRRAALRCEQMIEQQSLLRIAAVREEGGARVIDCGVHLPGGLEAGRALAEVAMADLGRVEFVPRRADLGAGLAVLVRTDHPLAACMAAQYAGWPIAGEKFFAMGSGPMRVLRGREELLEHIGWKEQASQAVGVLECAKLPSGEVCEHVASECHVDVEHLTLLVAPTASLAGTIQVVARSVETTLHKLHELKFDLSRIVSAAGSAPLPPIAADDLTAIGRTNDAILYGGDVTLWVRGDDEDLRTLGPQIPSSSSSDFGQPFADLFERYDRDFYKIDPLLFSPALVTLINLETGCRHEFGKLRPDILARSLER